MVGPNTMYYENFVKSIFYKIKTLPKLFFVGDKTA